MVEATVVAKLSNLHEIGKHREFSEALDVDDIPDSVRDLALDLVAHKLSLGSHVIHYEWQAINGGYACIVHYAWWSSRVNLVIPEALLVHVKE